MAIETNKNEQEFLMRLNPYERQIYLNNKHKTLMKLTPAHKAALSAIAADLGISLDEVVEQAIAQFLESYPKGQNEATKANDDAILAKIWLEHTRRSHVAE